MVVARVLIAGGGLAGLTAASALSGAGAEVILVEAGRQLGGRLALTGHATVIQNGQSYRFPVEHGIHHFWRRYVNARAFLDRHGLLGELVSVNGQEVVARLEDATIRHLELGRRVAHSPLPHLLAFAGGLAQPAILGDLVHTAGLPLLASMLDLLHGFAYERDRDAIGYDRLTAADVLASYPTTIRALFVAIIHSCYFVEPTEVSLASFFDCFQHYFALDKRDTSCDTLRGGTNASLLVPVAADLRRAGVRIRLRTRLVRLDRERAVLAVDGERPVTETFDGAVLALDAPGLQTLADTGLPVNGQVPTAIGSVVVRLWFSRTPVNRRADCGVFHGLGASNFFWLDRAQAPFAAWHRRTGGAVLECHVYAGLATDALRLDDTAVAARAETAALAAWPELAGTRVACHVLRNPATHTHFAPGTMARPPMVRTSIPGVALAGDFVAGNGMYMERAVLTGLLAARAVAADVGIRPAALPEPLEEPAVPVDVRALQRVSRVLRAAGVITPIRAWAAR
jgi:isorenieratene synthase